MSAQSLKVVNVVGARPNFMKIAPLMDAYEQLGMFEAVLVHTGQHYDERMSELFFRQLRIPEPDINLEVGSASHAVQTAEIMRAFEPVVEEQRPELVVVVGDVNSTIACAMVAVKLGVPVAHVEAGLRSFDRSMPEEINRVLTDSISDLLFCTEQSGLDNLRAEGIPSERLHLVGNVMIDTLMHHRERAEKSAILSELGLEAGHYAVLTLHRPSNVDDAATLSGIVEALEHVQRELPIAFPVHPRTRARLSEFGLQERIDRMSGLRLLSPLGYLDFLKLLGSARVSLTDSGGIQEETTILGVPCLTLRHNTERPATVNQGTNTIVGTDPERIVDGYRAALEPQGPRRRPPLWDGRAARRIADIMARELGGAPVEPAP